jgi:hypothetical protein
MLLVVAQNLFGTWFAGASAGVGVSLVGDLWSPWIGDPCPWSLLAAVADGWDDCVADGLSLGVSVPLAWDSASAVDWSWAAPASAAALAGDWSLV